jgi:CheY-like chemotaxis protein
MMLVDVLDDAGFKVMEAARADEALHVLATVPEVQVFVTDVEMPRGSVNGFELARRVRDDRQDAWPPQPGTCRRRPISSESPFALKDCLS